MESNILKVPLKAEIVLDDRKADEHFSTLWPFWRESHLVPLRLRHAVTLREVALPHVDSCATEEVSVIFTDKCLVFIVAVNDEGRELLHTIGLINQVKSLIVDWVEVVIHNMSLRWHI